MWPWRYSIVWLGPEAVWVPYYWLFIPLLQTILLLDSSDYDWEASLHLWLVNMASRINYVFNNKDSYLFLKAISVLYVPVNRFTLVFQFSLCLFALSVLQLLVLEVPSKTHLVPSGTSCLHWMHVKLEFNSFQFLTKKRFSCIIYISIPGNHARIAPKSPWAFIIKTLCIL